MKLKGSALIRSMPHIQCPQQTEWLSDRMTKWRCDSRTRNKRSVLILLTVPSRGWHWAMCTSVGPTWLTHLPPSLWPHHFLLCSMQCECDFSSSEREHHHYTAFSHIWHAHPPAGAAVLGASHLFLSHRAEAIEPQNGTVTVNYQPNHILPGFLLMMMTAQGVVAAVAVAVGLFLTGNLTFSTLLYGRINADICHSECLLLFCPSLLCGQKQPQRATRVCQSVSRAGAQLECEIYNTIYNGECGMCMPLIWIEIC